MIWVSLCIRVISPTCQEGRVPYRTIIGWHQGKSPLPAPRGQSLSNKGGEYTVSESRTSPDEMLQAPWELQTRSRDTETWPVYWRHRLSGFITKGWAPSAAGPCLLYFHYRFKWKQPFLIGYYLVTGQGGVAHVPNTATSLESTTLSWVKKLGTSLSFLPQVYSIISRCLSINIDMGT